MTQFQLDPQEFLPEIEANLGRANGNIWQRKPGVEGVHDGQVAVRLKKKRFVILDYSIDPTDVDMQAAELDEHFHVPQGAGKTKCVTQECTKVGIPVVLYDSEPHETPSLYIRSGLCFQCQRNLNEKRRTERKRPASSGGKSSGPSLFFVMGPSNKKFKVDGKTVHLNSDAIIINGTVQGTKPAGEGYGFTEIGADLTPLAKEAAVDVERLVNAVSSHPTSPEEEMSAEAAANAVAQAIQGGEGDDVAAATAAAVSGEDISALYDKAFQSLNKSIFLLSQWKASWDNAVESAAHDSVVADASLADAVASAAAVAAAVTDGGDQSNQSSANMVSLLLAADKRKDKGATDVQEV